MAGFDTAIFSKTSGQGGSRLSVVRLGRARLFFSKTSWFGWVGSGLAECGRAGLFFLRGFWRRFETPPNPFVLVLLQMPSSLVREICTVLITN